MAQDTIIVLKMANLSSRLHEKPNGIFSFFFTRSLAVMLYLLFVEKGKKQLGKHVLFFSNVSNVLQSLVRIYYQYVGKIQTRLKG